MSLLFVRTAIDLMVRFLYCIRLVNPAYVPSQGGVLLISNHLSLMDGFLVGWAARHRNVRFMIYRPYYEHKFWGWFLKVLKAIPVGISGPRDLVGALQAARRELEAGHAVCIFAEGSVSRTGNILPFKRGMEKVLDGLNVPVVPVHLDRVWGGFLSFAGGSFGGKRPGFRRPITVSFGKPMPATSTAGDVRQAVAGLAADAFALRKTSNDTLPSRFIRSAKRNWSRFCMADSSGRELAYGRVLTAALILAGDIRKRCAGQQMVGLLLPSTVGGALANLGVALTGKIPVNLNFTAGKEAMELSMQQCSIKTVLTSKVFLAKAKLEAPQGAVYLEDVLKSVSGVTKLAALLKARLVPAGMLTPKAKPDDLATVIFSSGSTGVPKGIQLSHFNIVSNCDAVLQLFHLDEHDRILGILPFFHSFGFMATIWLPLLAECGAVYHPVPTDAKVIGELVEKYKGTFLLSTPTFCMTYVRKCTREQFASLRYVVVGAEKLRETVRNIFVEHFGTDLLEGYGCTELSPVVAVNTPDFREGKEVQIGTKYGTIGLPIPGVAVRVVDPDTRRPLGVDEPGMLEVRGPNVMLGYLDQPERTRDVMDDGWYVTGDIAALDADGFIRITDRLSRFSKIGGEMVPHLKIEEAVTALFPSLNCAVTGIVDDRKGERLCLLYVIPDAAEIEPSPEPVAVQAEGGLEVAAAAVADVPASTAAATPEGIWKALSATDIPKLWIPKITDIHHVESLPVLGTGKLDLRGVKKMAEDLAVRA